MPRGKKKSSSMKIKTPGSRQSVSNMKYEIALKQIALEEAQKNKSSMRMKRDAQGNYSYVYAGDEDDISSKTQELADAQNQLYNLDKEQYRQNMDDIVSYTAEMQEKIKELYEDPAMDPAVREEREKTIREQYGELINNIIADNERAARIYFKDLVFNNFGRLAYNPKNVKRYSEVK